MTGGFRVVLGTENGVRLGRIGPDGFVESRRALAGEAVRGLAVDRERQVVYVACGLRGWGLHRLDLDTDGDEIDTGRVTALGLSDRWVWGVERAHDGTLYAGTEPPGLFRSTDGGTTWTELSGVTSVPSRDDWTFYHHPFGDGHVHAVSVHPERPDRIVAGVEDGPLLRSTDGGATWHEWLTGHDTHRTTLAPGDPDRVFVATADGLFERRDAGDGWSQHLDGAYVHQIAFHPADPERAWVYAATDNPVWRSDDGGRSWTPASAGPVGDAEETLPAARAAVPLLRHPTDPNTVAYAAGETVGRLFWTTDAGESWRLVDDHLPKVWRTAVLG